MTLNWRFRYPESIYASVQQQFAETWSQLRVSASGWEKVVEEAFLWPSYEAVASKTWSPYYFDVAASQSSADSWSPMVMRKGALCQSQWTLLVIEMSAS